MVNNLRFGISLNCNIVLNHPNNFFNKERKRRSNGLSIDKEKGLN